MRFTNILLLIGFLSLSCTKSNDPGNGEQSFCEVERELNENLSDVTAQLIYLESKNRFALKNYPVHPTMDQVTFFVICNKPDGISVEETVEFSGKSYLFNPNEGFAPSVGGENFYYLEIESIKEKL